MRAATATVAFITALAAAGHGCGNGNDSGGGGGAIPLAQFANEYAKTVCRRTYRCCDVIERGAEPERGPTEADCVVNLTAQVSTGIARAQADADAGRLIYHGDAARRCLDNAAALSCADYGSEIDLVKVPGCLALIEGQVAVDQPCTNSDQCASGRCTPSLVGAGMVCAATVGEDEECSVTADCRRGLYCAPAVGALYYACTAPGPIGALCTEDDACRNDNCPDPISTEPRTCAAPLECNGV